MWELALSVFAHSDFPPPGFSFLLLPPFLISSSSSWTMSWCLTITASVSLTHTHESLSPYTLNDFPVLPWCVHHFCFTLGSNWLNLCFSMTDYFVFSFVLPLKLSGSIQIHELDLFFSLINNYLFWRVRCYLFEFLCLFSRARWRWQLYMMRYNLSLETNMLNSFFLSSCAWHFKPASDQTVLLLLHQHLETC